MSADEGDPSPLAIPVGLSGDICGEARGLRVGGAVFKTADRPIVGQVSDGIGWARTGVRSSTLRREKRTSFDPAAMNTEMPPNTDNRGNLCGRTTQPGRERYLAGARRPVRWGRLTRANSRGARVATKESSGTRAIARLALTAILVVTSVGFAAAPSYAGDISSPGSAGKDAREMDAAGVGPIPADNEVLPSTSPLVPVVRKGSARENDGVVALAVTYSPSGCYGQTDYPHISYPYASVHGRTKCAVAVSQVTATATLLRSRWWGWETVKVGSTASRLNSSSSGDSTPHWKCSGTYTYKGDSTHTSLEGGVTYSARTDNTARFACSLL